MSVLLGLVLTGASLAPCQTVSLSGTVTTPSGQGVAGVGIAFRHNGVLYQTTSKVQGTWSLSSTATALVEKSGNVVLEREAGLHNRNGHLALSLAGYSASGQELSKWANVTKNTDRGLASRTVVVSDTLIYRWKGREVGREVLTSSVQNGLLRVVDTAMEVSKVAALVGTWKGQHQGTNVDFVLKADSSVSILRIPQVYGASAIGYRFVGKLSSATQDHLLLKVPTVESTTDGKLWTPVAPSLIAAFGLATGLDCTYVLNGTTLTLTQAMLGGAVALVKQ